MSASKHLKSSNRYILLIALGCLCAGLYLTHNEIVSVMDGNLLYICTVFFIFVSMLTGEEVNIELPEAEARGLAYLKRLQRSGEVASGRLKLTEEAGLVRIGGEPAVYMVKYTTTLSDLTYAYVVAINLKGKVERRRTVPLKWTMADAPDLEIIIADSLQDLIIKKREVKDRYGVEL